MWTYQLKDVQASNALREAMGEDVELFEDDRSEPTVYHILTEFSVGGNGYAVLQSDEPERTDEIEFFRIVKNEDGTFGLETIDDDDEWENVAELYDEMTFAEDENA